MLQDANRAGLEHLQRWAMTRTGYHGTRVDGQEPGRFEPAGIVVTSWLQGTSRDGDPHDHVHNQIARMSLTARDGKWRAVDTMGVRAQLDAVRAIVTAHAESGLTRKLGVELDAARRRERQRDQGHHARADRGVLVAQRSDRRSNEPRRLDALERKAPRAEPTRRELQYIHREVWAATRDAKPEGPDRLGQDRRGLGCQVGGADGTTARRRWQGRSVRLARPGRRAARTRASQVPRRRADAQMRAMQCALARVQEQHSTWTRAELMREIADNMPPETHLMAPADAVALLQEHDRPHPGRRSGTGDLPGGARMAGGAGLPAP